MSIMTLGGIGTAIGKAANWGLSAYGAYSAAQAVRRPAPGAGGRLLTGAVAGAAGYLAGRENGNGGYRRRRAKGLSGSDIKGFNKTCRLLNRVGMVPRKLKGCVPKTRSRACK